MCVYFHDYVMHDSLLFITSYSNFVFMAQHMFMF
jgi:hypothetical protein